jgi:hypothetical protein
MEREQAFGIYNGEISHKTSVSLVKKKKPSPTYDRSGTIRTVTEPVK